MKGLLLAGGHGTRLRPLTYTGNKHMLPVANKPILFYGLENLKNAGISEIAIIIGPVKEEVKESVGDGSKFGVNITYVDQPEPKGIAHAISLAEDLIGDEPFVVHLGDNMLKHGIKQYSDDFRQSNADALILLTPVDHPRDFGIAELEEDGTIKKLVEKPKEPKSNLAVIGAYFFKSIIFEAVKNIKLSWRNELEIADAMQYLIDNGFKVSSKIVYGWWKDTGKPEDILEANRLVLDDIKSDIKGVIENSVIKGRVIIGEDSVIKDSSTVKGPSVIGENCIISNAYIGSYTSIGNNCTIENTEVEDSIIMESTKIINAGRIVDSLIGKNVIIKKGNNLPKGKRLIIGDSSWVVI
ncbi:glucose-1-phosphate thymidylyltransferase [candidate division WOR-3 bacterium]|nr:glucose-1-phosphate thymidylyltransferase [candidate division WOR-3 bacterium]